MNRKGLVRPLDKLEAVGGQVGKVERVVFGVDSDDDEAEPEEMDEQKEPEEAIDPIRKRVEPLPSEEEQRRHRITHLPLPPVAPAVRGSSGK